MATTGTVSALKLDKGYGFIQRPDGQPDCFFHMRDLVDLEFSEQLTELAVQFEVINDNQKGPRAQNVRAVR